MKSSCASGRTKLSTPCLPNINTAPSKTGFRAQGAHDETVKALESWLDMRQSQLNTLIDVIVQGNGTLSKRKRKLAEGLSDAQLAKVESTVSEHFATYINSRT